MRLSRHAVATLVALCLGAAAAVPQAIAAPEPAGNRAAARVWFLWLSSSMVGDDTGATPTIYANGAPVGAIRGGAEFYRDFAPGTYQFAVQPYGLPTGQTSTVQLAAGTQTYLQVQWSPTWEQGYATGRGLTTHSFFIVTMAPQLAQVYLPTLSNLGGQ